MSHELLIVFNKKSKTITPGDVYNILNPITLDRNLREIGFDIYDGTPIATVKIPSNGNSEAFPFSEPDQTIERIIDVPDENNVFFRGVLVPYMLKMVYNPDLKKNAHWLK